MESGHGLHKKRQKAEISKELDRVVKEAGDIYRFSIKSLFFQLPNYLTADEEIGAVTLGIIDLNVHLIVLTNWRIITLVNRAFAGDKVISYDLDKISRVSANTKMPGFFSLGKKSEIEFYTSEGNLMNYKKLQPKSAANFINKYHEAIAKSRSSASTSVGAQTDIASQLEKLAALLDRGHITAEEFSQQKQRLLS